MAILQNLEYIPEHSTSHKVHRAAMFAPYDFDNRKTGSDHRMQFHARHMADVISYLGSKTWD